MGYITYILILLQLEIEKRKKNKEKETRFDAKRIDGIQT